MSLAMKSPWLNVVTTQGWRESLISSTAGRFASRATKTGRTHSPRLSPTVEVIAREHSASSVATQRTMWDQFLSCYASTQAATRTS